MLSPDQNKVFDDYDFMFATEGWKSFMDHIKQNKESIFPQIMHSAVKLEDVYFLKGRNDVFDSILGLQNLMENAKKHMEEQEVESE